MASAKPSPVALRLRTHLGTTTRFPISRANLRQKWINSHIPNNAGLRARLAILAYHRSYSLCSSISVCSTSLLSSFSLCTLFRPRFPHLRSPLSMTTQANSDPPQSSSSTKTVCCYCML